MTPIDNNLTPLQKFISRMEEFKKDYSSISLLLVLRLLKQELQTEKEWAEKVWEAGEKKGAGDYHCIETAGKFSGYPDFNSFYSQYNVAQ